MFLACLANSASALNGDTYVTSCICATTNDFEGMALNAAGNLGHQGVFTIVSSSQGSTALMKVTGHNVIGTNGEPYWVPSIATPLDASGNSLAGQLEADRQSFYTVFDLVTFGVSRSNPILLPGQYPFFGSVSDSEMSDSINATLVGFQGGSVVIASGFIEVTFLNGDKAQYIQSPKGSNNWVWNGYAYNAAGSRIDRNGTVMSNPNTGGRGGGGYQGHGFGNGSGAVFDMEGSSNCQSVTTITVNGEVTSYVFVAPC